MRFYLFSWPKFWTLWPTACDRNDFREHWNDKTSRKSWWQRVVLYWKEEENVTFRLLFSFKDLFMPTSSYNDVLYHFIKYWHHKSIVVSEEVWKSFCSTNIYIGVFGTTQLVEIANDFQTYNARPSHLRSHGAFIPLSTLFGFIIINTEELIFKTIFMWKYLHNNHYWLSFSLSYEKQQTSNLNWVEHHYIHTF